MHNKAKFHRGLIPRLLFILLLLSGTALILLYLRRLPVTFMPASFVETTDLLDNPWRGFYQMRGYKLSEEGPSLSVLTEELKNVPASGLFLLQINLCNYQNTALSPQALAHLRELLTAWSADNRRLILRFVYDWDGKCLDTEPESLDTILKHISAVSPVVNEFSDSVYLVQGLFLGNYGEMHGSRHMSAQNMDILAELLCEALSPDIFLSVRTPAQLRSILKTGAPLAGEEAFNGSLAARLGLFNDGMLGSMTDVGTYADSPPQPPYSFTAKLDRAGELDFQNRLNRYVPNGGEVILDNPFNDLEEAAACLAQMHVSYLNSEYDLAVLEKWSNSIFTGEGVFQGMNGLDYISAHLGYRYTLQSCELSFDSLRDEEAELAVTLANTGFSACYRPLEAFVALRREEDGESLVVPLPQDLRYLDSGTAMVLTAALPVRELKKGSYLVTLTIQDCSDGTEIQLANFSDGNGYMLGTLKLGRD